MKLDFLTENTPDWSQFKDRLSNDKFNNFMNVVSLFTKGLKFVHAEDKNNMMSYQFANTLVELEILAGLSGKDEPYIMLMVVARIANKLMIERPDSSADDRTLLNFHVFMHDDSAVTEAEGIAKNAQKTIDEFVEWYFDMSGEYGKVKLLQVQGSTIEGYSRGGENRFVAIAGDFCADKDPTDKNQKEIQKRVF